MIPVALRASLVGLQPLFLSDDMCSQAKLVNSNESVYILNVDIIICYVAVEILEDDRIQLLQSISTAEAQVKCVRVCGGE